MLKHQRLFVAMEQRIDSGLDLIDDMNASLESLNQGMGWLDRLEAGDTTAVPEVLTKHGHEIETVSTEGVQVHVNSGQVQAIVDFLKKWIPRFLSYLRDLVTRVIKWVREKLQNLKPRIDDLKKKTWEGKNLAIPVRDVGPSGKAAASLIHARSFDRIANTVDNANIVKIMEAADDWAYVTGKFDTGAWAEADVREVNSTGERIQRFVTEWLNFGQAGVTFDEVGTGEAGELLLQYVNGLPSASTVFNQAVERIGEDKQNTVEIYISVGDAKNLTNQLDQLQLKLLGTANDLNRLVDKAMQKLRAYESDVHRFKVDTKGKDDLAKIVRAAMKLINYMYNATSVGLQGRLTIMGNAVSMLEKVTPHE
jgi:hypothetical protein